MKRPDVFKFRLYITGNAPNSVRATANLNDLCRHYLPDRYHVEIVDLLHEPQRALADGVMMTPTLVKFAPAPKVHIVGALSDLSPILSTLGLNKTVNK